MSYVLKESCRLGQVV